MRRRTGFVPDVDHDKHPGLTARVELAARALAALHFELRPGRRRIAKLAKLADAVRNYARREAAYVNSHTDFMNEVVGEVERIVARQPPGSSAQYVNDFKVAVGHITCARCTRGRQCSGSLLHDPAIVAAPENGTLCLDFLFIMFRGLVELAWEQYRGLLPGPAPHLTLRLLTAANLRDSSLGGETCYPPEDSATSRRVDVTITLPVESFDGSHLGDLPYVVFHEIFIHGPEAWGVEGVRGTTPEICAFREGFVDAAAVHVLRKALDGRRVRITSHTDSHDLFAVRVKEAHSVRAICGRAAAPGTSAEEARKNLQAAREQGVMAFQKFELRGLADWGARLAAALNTLDVGMERRLTYLTLLEFAAEWLVPETPAGKDSPLARFALRLFQLCSQDQVNVVELQQWIEAHLLFASEETLDDLDF